MVSTIDEPLQKLVAPLGVAICTLGDGLTVTENVEGDSHTPEGGLYVMVNVPGVDVRRSTIPDVPLMESPILEE